MQAIGSTLGNLTLMSSGFLWLLCRSREGSGISEGEQGERQRGWRLEWRKELWIGDRFQQMK